MSEEEEKEDEKEEEEDRIEVCFKCGVKTASNLLTRSPWHENAPWYENVDKFCPNCYKTELAKYKKSVCFRCNPKTPEAIGDICDTCTEEGWSCYYDFYMGETFCYKIAKP